MEDKPDEPWSSLPTSQPGSDDRHKITGWNTDIYIYIYIYNIYQTYIDGVFITLQ